MQYYTGLEYIKIAAANAAGLDKLLFEERIDWFDKNIKEDKVIELDVEEPILFDKAIRAYQDAIDDIPTGFIMGFDSTSSGLQVMAVLSGCIETAKKCNLVDTGKRENAYSYAADGMNTMLSNEMWVTASDVKKPLMTHFYNSKATPKRMFHVEQLEAFYRAIAGEFPGADDVMDSINSCWSNKEEFTWTLPDGFVVVNRNFLRMETNLEICGAEFSYTWTEQSCNGNPLPLPANIVHSVDGYIAREVVRRCDFEVLTVHDCFYCGPNHMNELRLIYKQILADITSMNLLQDILRSITGQQDLIYNKVGDSEKLYKEILKSVYAIC